jgi:hypothetical protein
MNRIACALLVLAVSLVCPMPPAAHAQSSVTVTVDAALNRRSINPLVYGVAWTDTATLNDLNCPSHRQGGNATTRYNWQVNADNRAADWYFESIAYSSATAGEGGDTFISQSKAANSEPMITIPQIGWVAKVGANRSKLSSFSIAKYGPQTGNDWQWFPDAGNGISSATGQRITGNNPNDANVPADALFQMGWVQHMVGRWGLASAGGLKYYILDNEPSLWHETHRDVHPTGATIDEVVNKGLDYAERIKAIDPGALVVGPEEWGWLGYLYSGYDQQYAAAHGWCCYPDRDAHGGQDFIPYYLNAFRQRETALGRRLLDVVSVHYYPQGGEFSDDTSSAMQLRRNRSTRSLWDPNYVDETWIGQVIKLVPRLKSWVNTYYPNTKIGVTEYNFGAEGHINGATTQADVLGIFGREGVDLANRWTTPASSTPTYKAMKMYRNYDGNKSTFGDTSVSATAPNPDNLSAFAAERASDGALTVMVINKTTSSTSLTVNIANFTAGAAAQAWRLTSSNAISRIADVTVGAGSFTNSVPAQSITLYVIPRASGGTVPAAPSGLTATASAPGQIAIAWTDNSSNETGFKIERRLGSGSWSQIATVGANVTTYTSTNLTAGATYSFRVRSYNATGNSAYSNTATATVLAPPAAPSGLTAAVASPTQVNLQWTDNSGNETGFKVERRRRNGSWSQIATVGANVTTYASTGLSTNVPYSWRIKSYNAAGTSAASNVVSATPR